MNASRYSRFLWPICTFLTLSCAIAGASSALAAPEQSAEYLFQQGNTLYEQGKYQEAQQIFHRIITEDGFSGPLLYNLANCYAQSGQTGLAILNYERALRLSPGDADIKGNLELLRKNQGLFREDLPLMQRIVSLLNLDQWTLLAGFFGVLFTLALLLGVRFPRGTFMRRGIGGFCLLGMVMAATGVFAQYRHQDEAVVTSPDTRLLLSPFPSAASVGTLQEGRIVYPTTRYGQFSLVEDQSGRSGWIETNAITSIMARTLPVLTKQQ